MALSPATSDPTVIDGDLEDVVVASYVLPSAVPVTSIARAVISAIVEAVVFPRT